MTFKRMVRFTYFIVVNENKYGQLYFIAIVPPEPIYGKAWGLKEKCRDSFGTKAALNSPPHVTLHMPFRAKDPKAQNIIREMAELAETTRPFEMSHKGFGCFEPRVIYINVHPEEGLVSLQKQVVSSMRSQNVLNADYKGRPFNPHMTIAFRDLSKSRFEEAWSFFREQKFDEKWLVQRFYLLRHNGRNWESFREFHFSKSAI